VTFTAEDVVERLADAGVRLDRGLTEADLKRIEKKYGFSFGPDQQALLRTALPLGDAWLNWRHATPANIKERLQRPVEGIVLDVQAKGFWPGSWGPKPEDGRSAEKLARERLAQVPLLVPVYGNRYLPAAPVPGGCPVFSVTGSDVTICADDLLNYAGVEFGLGSESEPRRAVTELQHVPFWSDLALGASGIDR
jgi:hypothetical protein